MSFKLTISKEPNGLIKATSYCTTQDPTSNEYVPITKTTAFIDNHSKFTICWAFGVRAAQSPPLVIHYDQSSFGLGCKNFQVKPLWLYDALTLKSPTSSPIELTLSLFNNIELVVTQTSSYNHEGQALANKYLDCACHYAEEYIRTLKARTHFGNDNSTNDFDKCFLHINFHTATCNSTLMIDEICNYLGLAGPHQPEKLQQIKSALLLMDKPVNGGSAYSKSKICKPLILSIKKQITKDLTSTDSNDCPMNISMKWMTVSDVETLANKDQSGTQKETMKWVTNLNSGTPANSYPTETPYKTQCELEEKLNDYNQRLQTLESQVKNILFSFPTTWRTQKHFF